ncbi:spore germination protein GerPB [Effusibacillus consociatus]|uniref:Spore germination protein GerPB n=1 Tax=Effusibacillus consociatus TaxID=1117041 RepID=A0ABV9Q9S0_9BACL
MKVVQTIHIGSITINTIGGASVLQIGSSGLIQAHSESYETTEVVKEPGRPPLAPPITDTPSLEDGVQVQAPEAILGGEPPLNVEQEP